MRVLAVCKEDPEFILGGMGRHVGELYRAMSKIGDVEIDLLTGVSHAGYNEATEYNGYMKHHADNIVCWKTREPGLTSILLEDLQVFRTLLSLIQEGECWDVVHCHEWNAFYIANSIADRMKIPLVSTMHLCMTKLFVDDIPDNFKGPTEFDTFMLQQEGHLITRPEKLILCSEAYGKLVKEHFFNERPYHVIYNGIRVDEWSRENGDAERARQNYQLPKRPIALFVGRIAEQKGIVEMLDAVELEDNGYCIVLVGEVNANTEEDKENWKVTKRIRRLCKKYPNRLCWVGFQKDQELKDLYCAANVVLMPSTHEPFGIVALEAMSMGVPLIATDADGLGEIVRNGQDTFAEIIKPTGEEINAALTRLRDEDRKKELIGLGKKRAAQFDWNNVAEQTVSVYEKAVKEYTTCQRY